MSSEPLSLDEIQWLDDLAALDPGVRLAVLTIIAALIAEETPTVHDVMATFTR